MNRDAEFGEAMLIIFIAFTLNKMCSYEDSDNKIQIIQSYNIRGFQIRGNRLLSEASLLKSKASKKFKEKTENV